jgi:hypothetical protein
MTALTDIISAFLATSALLIVLLRLLLPDRPLAEVDHGGGRSALGRSFVRNGGRIGQTVRALNEVPVRRRADIGTADRAG